MKHVPNKLSKITNWLTPICLILFIFSESSFPEIISAQTKTVKRTVKRKQKTSKVSTQIYQTLQLSKEYISDEGNFAVTFPNTTPTGDVSQRLKQSNSVFPSELGALPTTQISLDAGRYFYAVIWYDLPNKVEGSEQMPQIVERAGFDKLKLSEAKVFDTSNVQLGAWLERGFECINSPDDSFMCVKERFFVYKNKLYRISSASNSLQSGTSKQAVEEKMNAFLKTFRLRQENQQIR